MQRTYHCPVLRDLCDQQIRFAPTDQRLQQVEVAERLISEIDPQKIYTYEYICFRITGYRPESYARTQISGEDLLHDLRLFVEDLSDATEQKVENIGEQVLTVEELAKQFNVSTKTISRWREQGLVSRRLVFDGRKRVGFLRSSVDRFVKNNQERVVRGARFSQLTDEQRQEIIDRARRMASAGGGQSEIARRLAKRMRPERRDDPLHDPAIRQAEPRAGDVPGPDGPAERSAEDADLPGVQARRERRQAGQAVRPHEDDHLPRDERSAGPADHGAAAGLHPEPAFRAEGSGGRVPGADAGTGNADPQGATSGRAAAVPGEPVRSAAA